MFFKQVLVFEKSKLYKKIANESTEYSLFQKKRTFNSDFFGGPPGERGPKIQMVNYVNGSFTYAQFISLTNLQPLAVLKMF